MKPTRWDRFVVWSSYRIARRNARRWSNLQLASRVAELEQIKNPHLAEQIFLMVYRASLHGAKC